MSRPLSFAFCGGAFGDEGKGRIVDKYVNKLSKRGKVVVYRDYGGANAGHTVEFKSGERVALHQLPSGVFGENTTVILGKGMVIHPADLLEEIQQVKKVAGGKIPAKIIIDENAVLLLDTHRAYESVLKLWHDGGKASTGRGIAPAYADVLLRQAVRVRDLIRFDEKVLKTHYRLYEALIKGLGKDMSKLVIPMMGKDQSFKVGDFNFFLNNLTKYFQALKPYVTDVHNLLQKSWHDPKISFVFEKAQAVGLHPLWAVYPDSSSSETTFAGIETSSEGIIDPNDIKVRAAVIKATYMSSVGTRKLPSVMDEKLAHQIREDANEYGASTKRPRDVYHLDLEAIRFFAKVGKATHMILTHMDIIYPKIKLKVCVEYEQKGKKVGYRPDQEFLNTVKPIYKELKPWDKKQIQEAKNKLELPKEAQVFIKFVEKEIGLPILMITTGPKRNQSIKL